VEGEEIFFVPNPGLGLWAYRGRFDVKDTPVIHGHWTRREADKE
jgi:hypothetical protein